MHFVAVRAAETEGEDRLIGAMDKYNNKYKKLSWLRMGIARQCILWQ